MTSTVGSADLGVALSTRLTHGSRGVEWLPHRLGQYVVQPLTHRRPGEIALDQAANVAGQIQPEGRRPLLRRLAELLLHVAHLDERHIVQASMRIACAPRLRPSGVLRSVDGMALGYVRPARDEDTAEIARVQYDTWRIAYPRFIPRFAVDAVRPEWLAEQWAEAVSRTPRRQRRPRPGRVWRRLRSPICWWSRAGDAAATAAGCSPPRSSCGAPTDSAVPWPGRSPKTSRR